MRALGIPSAANLRIIAQSSKVITLHFQVFTFHRRKCSVFERCRQFRRLTALGAGDENRTRVLSVGSGCFARTVIIKYLINGYFRVLKSDEITTGTSRELRLLSSKPYVRIDIRISGGSDNELKVYRITKKTI